MVFKEQVTRPGSFNKLHFLFVFTGGFPNIGNPLCFSAGLRILPFVYRHIDSINNSKTMKSYKMKSYLRISKGQAMIEFALAIPFLLLILFSVLYFGRYFLVSQVLLFAAQEGAKIASRTPGLSNNSTRDMVRGFTTGGAAANTNSVIYTALASAGLLSQTNSGSMPPGSSIQILPWDGASGTAIPAGTVAVNITYPFQLLGNPFTGQSTGSVQSVAVAMSFTAPALKFPNFKISQQAVAAEEVYQQ